MNTLTLLEQGAWVVYGIAAILLLIQLFRGFTPVRVITLVLCIAVPWAVEWAATRDSDYVYPTTLAAVCLLVIAYLNLKNHTP